MSQQADEISRSWDQNAAVWVRAVREGLIPSRRIATDQAIVDAVLARSPRRILDAGCGEGWLLRRLFEAGVRDLAGFDGSADLIAAAGCIVEAHLHVATYDEVTDNPVSMGSDFDAVICNFSILEERIAPFLRALAQCLCPGGFLFIQTLAPQGPRDAHSEWRVESFQRMDGTWRPMPYFFRTLAGWRETFQEAGLTPVRLREPKDPATGRVLSLLFELQPEESVRGGIPSTPAVS